MLAVCHFGLTFDGILTCRHTKSLNGTYLRFCHITTNKNSGYRTPV